MFQLADDSSIGTKSFGDLVTGFDQLMESSNSKYMVTNFDKTFYLQLCDNPAREPIRLRNGNMIFPAKNDEHLSWKMFMSSNNIALHIKRNLARRAFNITKFFSSLEINEMTPIKIKVQVLDTCMLGAYLYGCELDTCMLGAYLYGCELDTCMFGAYLYGCELDTCMFGAYLYGCECLVY